MNISYKIKYLKDWAKDKNELYIKAMLVFADLPNILCPLFNVSVGDGWNPSPSGEEKIIYVAMRRYRVGAHTKTDLKVHLVWVPKYRKKVLTGEVAIRVRDLLKQIAIEHELEVISGKVATDHVHMFISYNPSQDISKIVQWLKGISSRVMLSEFSHLRRQFWGRHLWARGYLAVSSGNVTDEIIQQYIDEQEGEPVVDDSRFQIDPS